MLLLAVKYIRLDKVCGNLFKSMQICIKLYIPAGTEGGLATPVAPEKIYIPID